MIYPATFETKTGFDRIKELLREYCTGNIAKEFVGSIHFSSDPAVISTGLDLTWEMQQVLMSPSPIHLDDSYYAGPILDKIRIEGSYASAEEYHDLRNHLEELRSVLAWFRKADQFLYPAMKRLSADVKYYPAVYEAIDRVLDKHGQVKDTASKDLREIRIKLSSLSVQVNKMLQSVLKSARADGYVDADSEISVRNGRCVIPVNAYNKRKIAGLVHDQSASGKTVYIEPAGVVELNNDIVELEYEEKREIVRIMVALADVLRPYIDDMLASAVFLGTVDFIRAKARLGNRLGSARPVISDTPTIKWKGAIHPLLFMAFTRLPGRSVVPLDISLDEGTRIVVISGPNAGGKSVCLKTAGLLQYMLQCGLTIPVSEGSVSGIFGSIFIDIGDEQSIENDLSTYSSHLMGMKFFLRNAGPDTLILIDEFGSGTEPVIGGAIAEAILSELNRRMVYGVITTHYTNLKHFASITPGIINGAMAFDSNLMQPLFRLTTGKPGSSFAFEIARKIGLPEGVLDEASGKAGRETVMYDKILREIARDRRYWEKKRDSVRRLEKRLEKLEEDYESGLRSVREKSREIISNAKKEAEIILSGSNKIIENTIREIREAAAEKEKTRRARKKLEDYKQEIQSRGGDNTDFKLPARAGKSKRAVTAGMPETDSAQVRPLTVGSYVKIAESDSTGVIEELYDRIAVVSFGSVTIRLPAEKLLFSTKADYDREHRQPARHTPDWGKVTRSADFKPYLDLRGMKTDDAIMKVQEFLDRAWVISYPSVSILHGKGYGILRQQIRQYLATLGYVRSYGDAPEEQGGAGITVVELDL